MIIAKWKKKKKNAEDKTLHQPMEHSFDSRQPKENSARYLNT